MKTKQLIITILMITFVTMITTKVEATENDEQVEQTQNIENIEKDKQYNLTKELKVKTLPLIFAIEKETIPSGNIRVTDILNDWCKIENEGKSGWIRINTIKTSVKQDNNQEEAKKEENLNTEGNNNQEQTNSSNEEESNQNQQENKTEEGRRIGLCLARFIPVLFREFTAISYGQRWILRPDFRVCSWWAMWAVKWRRQRSG